MFETLTITTLFMIAFFFWQNQRLGLTSAIPKDPDNLVHYYCSECLMSLKSILPKAKIVQLQEDRLTFIAEKSQVPQEMAVSGGKLQVSQSEGKPKTLNPLGDQGNIQFEKISENGLMITVEARTAEASHRVSLRLEVEYSSGPG